MQLDNIFELIQQAPKLPFKSFVDNVVLYSINSRNVNDLSRFYNDGFIFKQYKSIKDSFDELEEIRAKPIKTTAESRALQYVNGNEFRNYKSYIEHLNIPDTSLDDIKKISSSFIQGVKTLINLGGLYANDKIIITEDSRGVFDFGLASLGLYRPIEFYSQELFDDINDGIVKNPYSFKDTEIGVIESNDVNKKIIGGVTFFTYTYLGKKYICERRQKGATSVFNTFSEECFLKPNDDGIMITYYLDNHNKVFNGSGKNKLKYASSNKKCYLIYNKKEDSVKNVDIFMPINYLTSADGGRAIELLPAYLIASALEEFGIQTRISGMRLGNVGEGSYRPHQSVSLPVKDYNESSKESFNMIFSTLAKTDTAGTYFAYLKILSENEGIQERPTNSYNDALSPHYNEQNYMDDMMQRYKNWIKVNKDKPFVNTRVVNDNFQFALKSSAIDDDLTFNNVLKYIHQIFFDFYYYMDFLAIEMLSMDVFVKSIYKRLTEDVTFRKLYTVPNNRDEMRDLIRSYVLSMLTKKYIVITGGKYFDTQEQVVEKENKLKEKVLALREALNIVV